MRPTKDWIEKRGHYKQYVLVCVEFMHRWYSAVLWCSSLIGGKHFVCYSLYLKIMSQLHTHFIKANSKPERGLWCIKMCTDHAVPRAALLIWNKKKTHWIRSKTRIQLLELVTATQSSLTWTSITFSIQCQACGSNLNRTNCARQMYIKKWTHSKCHNEL